MGKEGVFPTEILKTVNFAEQRDFKNLCQEAASSWEKSFTLRFPALSLLCEK